MQKQLLTLLSLLSLTLIMVNCANRGNPQGGEKDITPPKIVKSLPENYSTNFNTNEIRVYFDEYIKIKDIGKQLIISPPMNTAPNITPLGSASKYIKIKIYDTLQPNTTYTFNFGNSIVDNNEENPFSYYKYVFSTGNYIDSLNVKGTIKDALATEVDPFVSVMLYEANDKYNDSLVYKENPKYITNTLDSTTNFSIDNVKAGKYVLLALKDENKDNQFQQKSDKIGFYKDIIEVPTTKNYNLSLFSENIDYKASKPQLVAGEKIAFGFSGNYKKTAIDIISEVPNNYKYRIMKDPKGDSLNYFYSPKLEVDSLLFKVSNKKTIDTFSVRIKNNKKDTLVISTDPKSIIAYEQDFKIKANIPFKKFNNRKITITDKDSLNIEYTSTYDTLANSYNLKFKKTEDNRYKIKLLPEALTDFFDHKNKDTLYYNIRTNRQSSYGNLRVELKNAIYPVIVQLTDDKGVVVSEYYSTEKNTPIDFFNLKPSKYNLRVIYDSNKNGVYDPGSFLKRRQSERVSYSNSLIEIRAGWDEITPFTLN